MILLVNFLPITLFALRTCKENGNKKGTKTANMRVFVPFATVPNTQKQWMETVRKSLFLRIRKD